MIGMRVEVMLGANKRYAGIIKKISDVKPDGFNPKPIIDILDEEPIVYEHQLKLWEWMAEYYMCSEGEVMQAAIPSHLKISSESIFILQEDASIDIKNLSDSEYIISEALEIKKELSLIEIQKLSIDNNSTTALIQLNRWASNCAITTIHTAIIF